LLALLPMVPSALPRPEGERPEVLFWDPLPGDVACLVHSLPSFWNTSPHGSLPPRPGAGTLPLSNTLSCRRERVIRRQLLHASTIGMTYQVSDTTLRDTRIRRTVPAHAFLSYLFGVVIVAGSVSLISGLIR
jgi:hypothetical protein